MKKRITLLAGALLLLILQISCGGFTLESRLIPEATPTLPAAHAVSDDSLQVATDQVNAGPQIGLSELLIIVGVLVTASLVIGIYLTLTDRSPINELVPAPTTDQERRTLFRLLSFRPHYGALFLTLAAWALVLGVLTIAVLSGLLLLFRALPEEESTIVLTQPSTLLIGVEEPYLHLVPEETACTLSRPAATSEQLLCVIELAGGNLKVDVVLEDSTAWYCSAFYDGQSLPCRASFSMDDLQTFLVINSDLGLSERQRQQLADEQPNPGWQEADWINLSRATAAVLALISLILLWRHSGKALAAESNASGLSRVIYSTSISFMIFGITNLLSQFMLLLLGLID